MSGSRRWSKIRIMLSARFIFESAGGTRGCFAAPAMLREKAVSASHVVISAALSLDRLRVGRFELGLSVGGLLRALSVDGL